MIKTDLKVGDEVILLDSKHTVPSMGKPAPTDEAKGNGYEVTNITKNYVECTHKTMDNCFDKRVYYGENDLHLIEVSS